MDEQDAYINHFDAVSGSNAVETLEIGSRGPPELKLNTGDFPTRSCEPGTDKVLQQALFNTNQQWNNNAYTHTQFLLDQDSWSKEPNNSSGYTSDIEGMSSDDDPREMISRRSSLQPTPPTTTDQLQKLQLYLLNPSARIIAEPAAFPPQLFFEEVSMQRLPHKNPTTQERRVQTELPTGSTPRKSKNFVCNWIFKETTNKHNAGEQCLKSFDRGCDLSRHKKIHTKEMKYKCPECSKTFARSDHLTTHRRTHTNEAPYQCLYHVSGDASSKRCDKRFKRADEQKRHGETHAKNGHREYERTEQEIAEEKRAISSKKRKGTRANVEYELKGSKSQCRNLI